jgi:hypothetical protein
MAVGSLTVEINVLDLALVQCRDYIDSDLIFILAHIAEKLIWRDEKRFVGSASRRCGRRDGAHDG